MANKCKINKDTKICDSCYKHSEFNKLKGSIDIGSSTITFPIKADPKNTCAFLNTSCPNNPCDSLTGGAQGACNNILQNVHDGITSGKKDTKSIIKNLIDYGTDDASKNVILQGTLNKLLCDISAAGINPENLPGAGSITMDSAKAEYDWYFLNNLGIYNARTNSQISNYNTSTEWITFGIATIISFIMLIEQFSSWWPSGKQGSKTLIASFLIILVGVIIVMSLTVWKSDISSDTEGEKDTDEEEGVKSDSPTSPSTVLQYILSYLSLLAIVFIVVMALRKGFSVRLLMVIPILFWITTTYFSYLYAPKLMMYLTFLLIMGELLSIYFPVLQNHRNISRLVLNAIIIVVIWMVYGYGQTKNQDCNKEDKTKDGTCKEGSIKNFVGKNNSLLIIAISLTFFTVAKVALNFSGGIMGTKSQDSLSGFVLRHTGFINREVFDYMLFNLEKGFSK